MTVFRFSDEELFRRLIAVVYDEMPRGEVSISAIAEELSLSPSQLNRRVKAATGKSATAFVMDLRMKKARHLMSQSGRYTISDVARLCGFADASHFSHAFRRIEGISPTQFIERHHEPTQHLTDVIDDEVSRQINKGK